jgi:hypothetical protein
MRRASDNFGVGILSIGFVKLRDGRFESRGVETHKKYLGVSLADQ